MIKNYDEFVNEGFLSDVMSGIEAGIGAFKASRGAEKAADEDLKAFMNGNANEFGGKAKMTLLVKQLVQRSAWLADSFSYDDLNEKGDLLLARIERIETILSEMKEMLNDNFDIK